MKSLSPTYAEIPRPMRRHHYARLVCVSLLFLIVSALTALARVGGADAVGAAIALASDTHHPFRLAAIEALGVLCDPRAGAATLRGISTGGDQRLAAAARAAENRCASAAR